jgi:hypothetical protein
MSTEQAQSKVSFTVFMPNHLLASEANVTATHVCTSADPKEVIVDFDSGIRLIIEDQGGGMPQWDKIAAQDPTMTLGVVRGIAALLADPTKDPSGQTPGGVEFMENGVLVTVAGNGKIPLDDLVKVAESLS